MDTLVQETLASTDIALGTFLTMIAVSIALGVFIAWVYTYKTRYTKSFVLTLSVLPAIVAFIIILVNGNLGAGIAVTGAFSLVRFRSVPGSAKEIGSLFLAMGTGLAMGMGYIFFAVIFVLVITAFSCLLNISKFGEPDPNKRFLYITIPEALDYTDVFEDLFQKYTKDTNLISVKTTNMGSLFKLNYEIVLNDSKTEKKFIDDLRCRNANLEISMSKQNSYMTEL